MNNAKVLFCNVFQSHVYFVRDTYSSLNYSASSLTSHAACNWLLLNSKLQSLTVLKSEPICSKRSQFRK